MKTGVIKILAIISIIFTLVDMTGCRKPCYKCSYVIVGGACLKGTDTVRIGGMVKVAMDSVNYYTSLGYLCDTFHSHLENDGQTLCEKHSYQKIIDEGG